MFHRVLPKELIFMNRRNAYLKRGTLISLETFTEIIEFILYNNFECINISKVSENNNSNNAIALTFDDGYSDNYYYVMPKLEKYGITATFFPVLKPCIENSVLPIDIYYWIADNSELSEEIYNDMITGEKKKIFYRMSAENQIKNLNEYFPGYITNNEHIRYLNKQEINEISKKGCEIGSHSVTHSLLTFDYMTESGIFYELSHSKTCLEEITGSKINSFCFPSGYYNKEIVQMAREIGYNSFCSIKYINYIDYSIYERFFVTEDSKAELFALLKN